MRELSLFTGAGGGILGTKLLGWTPVGYVEWDDYCQRVLRQRQEDGLIERAPIFGDIRAFISEGYARRYRGMVDVITAGFPCQPFSVAGKQVGENDPRNMWPATIKCIRVVRPRYALLENVPGLLSSGYFGRVLGDLAESGYDVKWRMLSAAELGASHLRDRVWILAHSIKDNDIRRNRSASRKTKNTAIRQVTQEIKIRDRGELEFSPTFDDCRHNSYAEGYRKLNDVAYKLDRFAAIGNGQVPAVVRAAWELLAGVA